MKIFLLHDPKHHGRCARFSHVGTWTSGSLCKKCGQPTSELVEPLQVEWEPDSDFVCDLSWCGYIAIAKKSLAIQLKNDGFEWDLGAIHYTPPKSQSKDKSIVSFPYTGPDLGWLMLSEQVPLAERKSDVELIVDCDKCLQRKYTFKTEGIVIDKENWRGQKVFHIEQFSRSRAMFATEEALDLVNAQSVDNIAFSEAGEIN